MNLERFTAEHGQSIAQIVTNGADGDKAENCVRKALGVLQENGVFACLLYCLSETAGNSAESRTYKKIVGESIGLLSREETASLDLAYAGDLNDSDAVLTYVRNSLLANHRTTFLVRRLFDQVLTYARFGIQALK